MLDSNLPSEIKDQFADRNYDQTKPYDQTIKSILNEKSFLTMLNAMKAGARALRNSDYVKPEIKRSLLREIMNCWEQASRVLFVVLPTLAEEGYATYDNLGILLVGNFGESVEQRFFNILNQIPGNVASWCNDDLFSQKMGPLLFDQLESKDITDICKHELILFLIQHRPRNWNKHVQRYIVSKSENSYYLMDVYSLLRSEYKYGYASNQTLIDIEHLIKVVAAKHITGVKDPGIKTLNKLNFKKDLIPTRVDNE